MKKFGILLILFFFVFCTSSRAQYISTSETVPFVCPTVCAGGTLVLKIFQLQNLTAGAPVQAVLSNAAGSFASGTTTINCNRYSLVSATGPWTNGAYTFTTNVSNLFFEFTIPAGATPATAYNVHFKSGATIGANMQMPCTGFNVTASYTPLTAVAPTTYGSGQWIAHAYTWTPTTAAMLSSPALVSAQDFFNPVNYQGHFLKNTLGFDLFYLPGSKMPGAIGVYHDGTSFQCGEGYTSNYSLRMCRTENFAAGLYQLEIQGDDGIRLSIDGGVTWLLNSFIEQAYAGSMKSTATLFPNGVCLSGPIALVIEYFQRPADAHLRFACNLISPNALAQPTDSIVCAGQNAAFSTTNISGVTYQWQMSTNGGLSFTPLANGVPYSGAATNFLQITSATSSLNATLYNCVVTGVCTNPITSSNALLSVTASAPIILTQPHDSTVCNLGGASFSVGTVATAVYQWQIDSSGMFVNLHNGGSYSNVSNATMNVSPITTGMNNIHYQCLVTGCGATTASSVVGLFVTANASITIPPINTLVCAGATATFMVTASNALAYQWQEDTGAGFVNIINGGIYSNATGATLNLSGVSAAMTGYQYQCMVTGCGAAIISDTAQLIVGIPASITTQAANTSLCLGASGSFIINTVPGLTYQWQVNSGSGFTNISNGLVYGGATSASLQILGMQASMNNYQYQCLVTGCGPSTVTSNTDTLLLGTTATISIQPIDTILCGTGNTSFTVAAANAQSYQWQVNAGSGFVAISNAGVYSNATTSTLNLTGANVALNGNQYHCFITSCSGTQVISDTALLTVFPLAAITAQPANQTVCIGSNATFACVASNAQSFFWYGGFGTVLVPLLNGGGVQINGDSITFLNVPNALNNYQVNCNISDCSGNISTLTVTLSVTSPVAISNASGNQNLCEGDNVNFSVSATNANSYQWQINSGFGFVNVNSGGVFSNTTSSVLTLTNASVLQNGWQFKCEAKGCGNSIATSMAATLAVLPVAVILAQTQDVFVCEGTNATLSVSTSFPANSYQWQVNSGSGFVTLSDGGIYSGTTTAVLSVSNVSANEDGNSYQCLYVSCGPAKTSLPIPFTVQTLPVLITQPVAEKKCENENALFSVVASGKNLTYHWQISSDAGFSFTDIPNSTTYSNTSTALLQISNVSSEMKNYLYRCAVDGCSQTVYSDNVALDAAENTTTLFIPSAFSPNNDGLNDYFQINPYGLKNIKGEIFDRWGELIYKWNSLTTKWDGKYNGIILPVGIYVYNIEATSNCADGKLEKRGIVSIIK